GRVHRPQARAEDLSPSHRLHRRHQGPHGEVDLRGPLPRAHRREGRRAHAPARPARSRAARQSARLSGCRASARGAEAGEARCRGHEPQEREECLIVAETVQSLEGLAGLKTAAPEGPKYEKKVDAQGRAYATGKRKNAVARVWIKPGSGKITVNTRTVEVFFARPVLRMLIQ